MMSEPVRQSLLRVGIVLLIMFFGLGDRWREPFTAAAGRARQAQTFPFGENIIADISAAGETDAFLFAALEGDVITARVVDCSPAGVFDPCMELRDPVGRTLAQVCDRTVARITGHRLAMSGSYSLIVTDDGLDRTGRYSFFLQRVNNPSLAEPLLTNDVLPGGVSFCGEAATYTFRGRAGDQVRISLTRDSGTSLTPSLDLYDETGRLLTRTAAVPEARIDRTLPVSGTFTVLAADAATQMGTYRISLSLSPGQTVLPFISIGRGIEGVRRTTILLANPSSTPVRGRMEFLQPDGQRPLLVTFQGVTDSQFLFSLSPGAQRVFESEDVGPPMQGFARLTSDLPLRVVVTLRSLDSSGTPRFETSYGTLSLQRTASVIADSMGEDTDTGIILYNPGDQRADVTIQLFSATGQSAGSPATLTVAPGTLSVGPSGEGIRFLGELFSSVSTISEFQGTMLLTSTTDVIVLSVRRRGTHLTILPQL